MAFQDVFSDAEVKTVGGCPDRLPSNLCQAEVDRVGFGETALTSAVVDSGRWDLIVAGDACAARPPLILALRTRMHSFAGTQFHSDKSHTAVDQRSLQQSAATAPPFRHWTQVLSKDRNPFLRQNVLATNSLQAVKEEFLGQLFMPHTQVSAIAIAARLSGTAT